MFAIYKKELRSYFTTAIGYVYVGVFLGAAALLCCYSTLMSGSYDLTVIVKGKTFQQVAMFVAKELATMHGVTGTATHFVLRRYKELDVALVGEGADDRGAYSL